MIILGGNINTDKFYFVRYSENQTASGVDDKYSFITPPVLLADLNIADELVNMPSFENYILNYKILKIGVPKK